MSAETVGDKGIKITKHLLDYAIRNPETIVRMAADDVSPKDVENVVFEILSYLMRPAEEPLAREDSFKILEIAESYIYQPTDFEEYNRTLRERGFKERTPPEVGRHE